MVSCVREKCIYQWKTLQNSLDYVAKIQREEAERRKLNKESHVLVI